MNPRKFYLISIILISFNLICNKHNIIQNNIQNNIDHNKNLNNKIEQTINNQNASLTFKECTNESRKVEYCIELYKPVCGWFTNNPTECKNIYCRESYANSCFACKDKRVIGYTEGKCKN